MTLLHQKRVPAKISSGRIYSTVDIITVKALEGWLPRHPCSGALAREAEHHGQENMVIYASKKFWFWEHRPRGIRPYVRPPLHVSGCEMAHLNTIFVKLGIGHPWSIYSCQKRVSADQCHMTASHVYNSCNWCNFFKLSADQLFVFNWSRAQVIFLKVKFSLLSAYGQNIINWGRHFLKHLSIVSLLALAKSIH